MAFQLCGDGPRLCGDGWGVCGDGAWEGWDGFRSVQGPREGGLWRQGDAKEAMTRAMSRPERMP